MRVQAGGETDPTWRWPTPVKVALFVEAPEATPAHGDSRVTPSGRSTEVQGQLSDSS